MHKVAKVFSVAAFGCSVLLLGAIIATPVFLDGSKSIFPAGTQAVIRKKLDTWNYKKDRDLEYMSDYSSHGDYLSYSRGNCGPSKQYVPDENGIMMKIFDGKPQYTPVTSAQCGLIAYGRLLKGEKNAREEAIRYADNLIALQSPDGSFRYQFPYRYYLTKEILEPGWVSGMAQGQAMSLLVRAYWLTQDQRYLQAGKKALAFLQVQTSSDGVMTSLSDLSPSLAKHIWFEEYVSRPANYTLNGYMFALLGLYDWSTADASVDVGQKQASELFKAGIQSLKIALPNYDLGKISAYDLGYKTHPGALPHLSSDYHIVHITQLNALYSVTHERQLAEYRDRWKLYAHPTIRYVNRYLTYLK